MCIIQNKDLKRESDVLRSRWGGNQTYYDAKTEIKYKEASSISIIEGDTV